MCGALLVALALSPLPAAAHGPAPAPLRILTTLDGHGDLIQTNIGIAVYRRDDLYRYICPVSWGGLETPLSVALSPDTLLLVGADGLYTSTDRGCNFTPVASSPFPSANGTALIDDGARAWALVRGDGDADDGSRLFAWPPTGPLRLALLDHARRWDAVFATADALVLSAARPVPSIVRVPRADLAGQLDGVTLTPYTPPSPVAPLQRLTVRVATADRIDLAAVSDSGVHWLRSTDGGATLTVVATGERSVHGPVPLCDGLLAVVDGEPVVDPDRPPTCDVSGLAGRALTCLGARDDLVYTCELRQLRRLAVQGATVTLEPLFALEQLVGPLPGCPSDPTAQFACQQDWLHYGAESGLVDPLDPFGDAVDDTPTHPDPADPDAGPDAADPDPDVAGPGTLDASRDAAPSAPSSASDGCQTTRTHTATTARAVALLGLLVTLGLALTRRRAR